MIFSVLHVRELIRAARCNNPHESGSCYSSAATVDFRGGVDTYHTCIQSEEDPPPADRTGCGLILSVLSSVEGHCVFPLLLSPLCDITVDRHGEGCQAGCRLALWMAVNNGNQWYMPQAFFLTHMDLMKNHSSLRTQIITFLYDTTLKSKVKFKVFTAAGFVLHLHGLVKKYWDRQKCVPRCTVTHLVTQQQCCCTGGRGHTGEYRSWTSDLISVKLCCPTRTLVECVNANKQELDFCFSCESAEIQSTDATDTFTGVDLQ